MKIQEGTIYKPDGSTEIIRPVAPAKKLSLEQLQAAVGGYIEVVSMAQGNGHATMYCNEEGMMMDLPPNPFVAKFVSPGTMLPPGGMMLGNVLVVRTVEL